MTRGVFFFFNDAATTEIYTLSLHDALPISSEYPHDCNQCSLRRQGDRPDRKSTRLNSSHLVISYAVFCLKKKRTKPSASCGPTPPGCSGSSPHSPTPR